MARPENTIWRHTPLPARVARALYFRQSEEWTEAHEESLQPCLVRLVCGSGVVGGLSGVLPHCQCSPYGGAILKSHVRFSMNGLAGGRHGISVVAKFRVAERGPTEGKDSSWPLLPSLAPLSIAEFANMRSLCVLARGLNPLWLNVQLITVFMWLNPV